MLSDSPVRVRATEGQMYVSQWLPRVYVVGFLSQCFPLGLMTYPERDCGREEYCLLYTYFFFQGFD